MPPVVQPDQQHYSQDLNADHADEFQLVLPSAPPNVIGNADDVMAGENDEEEKENGGKGSNGNQLLSLGQRISLAGKKMEEPKHRISFKEAVKKFKSKEELYFTLAVRGK